MKDRVIDKEVNAAWFKSQGSYQAGGTNKSTDKVWLLTATEIGAKTVAPTIGSVFGATINSALTGDGEEYDYFLDDVNKRKSIGNSGKIAGSYSCMWLATGGWYPSYPVASAVYVFVDGTFNNNAVSNSFGVVPAVRVS